MKTDSVVNLAALAALCGTAGVAGYYNQCRKKKRDNERVKEILESIKEQDTFNKEAYCQRYFMHKLAGKICTPLADVFSQPQQYKNTGTY